jgi:hypothetical protein
MLSLVEKMSIFATHRHLRRRVAPKCKKFYSLRSLMIASLILPPILATVWIALRRKEMREAGAGVLAFVTLYAFGFAIYFGVLRIWNYRR